MKKLFCIAAFLGIGYCASAQQYICQKIEPEIYCVISSHGNHYITHDGVKEDKDVKLQNGNIIHSEGVIETKDHFITMKPNQCIRFDDYIVIFTEEVVENK